MRLNKFMELCMATNKYTKDEMLICGSLGVASEAGEIAGKVDKWIRKNHNTDLSDEAKKAIALECFDVIWFAMCVLTSLGFKFQTVARLGLHKLDSRNKRGQICSIEGGDNR